MPRNSDACSCGKRHRPGTIHSSRTLRRRYSKHRNRMNASEVPKRQPTPYLLPRAYMPLSLRTGVAFNMHRYTSSLAHHHQECWQPPKRQCPHKNILLGVGWAEERMDGRGRRILLSFHFQSTVVTDNIFHSCDNAAVVAASAALWPVPPPRLAAAAAADFQHGILNGGIAVRAPRAFSEEAWNVDHQLTFYRLDRTIHSAPSPEYHTYFVPNFISVM